MFSATRNIVDSITRGVYILLGIFYLLLGFAVLNLGTSLLPTWVHDKIFELGYNNPDHMHLIQEIGTLWILVAMLFFWFFQHYEKSVMFHWAMTITFALDAWVHWFTAYGVFEHELRAVINAIPFVLFLILGLLRRAGRASHSQSSG